jgi:hypothetical protein
MEDLASKLPSLMKSAKPRLAFTAAKKPRFGMPARWASSPAERLPRFPEGTTKRAGRSDQPRRAAAYR